MKDIPIVYVFDRLSKEDPAATVAAPSQSSYLVSDITCGLIVF